MKTIVQAVAAMEGFGHDVHNIPTRDQNPGDIIDSPFARAHGESGKDGRFAVFPSAAAGFAALRALLTQHYLGMTILAAFNKYAPPTDGNDTSNYVHVVCELTGLAPTDVLTVENIG